VGIVTDGMPSVFGSKSSMVSLYKYMHELDCQNGLKQYHWIISQQNLIFRALEFKEIITCHRCSQSD
jgi:hypothetical protein